MSEYKNDENHNEMETPITSVVGGKWFGRSTPQRVDPQATTTATVAAAPGKLNEHLKLVVNEFDNSVSIYNSIDNVVFDYDDFVMRFTGDGKDDNFKKAMKRLNIIRVLIEKSIRFQKNELNNFKTNTSDKDLDLLLDGNGTHVLKDGEDYSIVVSTTSTDQVAVTEQAEAEADAMEDLKKAEKELEEAKKELEAAADPNSPSTQFARERVTAAQEKAEAAKERAANAAKAAAVTKYFTPYTMMYDIMNEAAPRVETGAETGEAPVVESKIKQLVKYLIKCGEGKEKKGITDGLDKILQTVTKDTYKTAFLDTVYIEVFKTIGTGTVVEVTETATNPISPITTKSYEKGPGWPPTSRNSTGSLRMLRTSKDKYQATMVRMPKTQEGGQKSKTLKRKQQTHNKSRRKFAYGGRKAYELRKKQRQQQNQN